jgi:hypothetical protein
LLPQADGGTGAPGTPYFGVAGWGCAKRLEPSRVTFVPAPLPIRLFAIRYPLVPLWKFVKPQGQNPKGNYPLTTSKKCAILSLP